MKNNNLAKILIFTLLTCFVSISNAAVNDPDPVKFLEQATTKIINALKRNEAAIDADPNKIYDVVDKSIQLINALIDHG